MRPTDPLRDAPASAAELRRAWERRAHSPHREFYVASHRGWHDSGRVERQARFDAEIVLHDLPAEWLARAQVLEIGCGSGRLARQIAPRVAGYTGIDIAPTMVAVARERLATAPNARLLVGSGESIPPEAADRRYGLVFSHAVLIHCPRAIVGAYVAAAWPLVQPGGQLRLQLLADPDDPTGIAPPEQMPPLPLSPPEPDGDALLPAEQAALVEIEAELAGSYYMGERFTYIEVEPFLRARAPGAHVRLLRFDREHIYAELDRATE